MLHLNNDDFILETSYQIRSTINDIGTDRYHQNIEGKLFITDLSETIKTEERCPQIVIGKLKGCKLLLGNAMNDNVSFSEVFDTQSNTFELIRHFYDFENEEWIKEVQTILDDSIGCDFLILERIEILPKYKNYLLGKKWIKDFYSNFIAGTGIIILKAFPLQHESKIVDNNDIWRNSMNYSHFEEDQDKAQKRLINYYKSIGFKPIKKSESNLLYINPNIHNKKLEKIKFT